MPPVLEMMPLVSNKKGVTLIYWVLVVFLAIESLVSSYINLRMNIVSSSVLINSMNTSMNPREANDCASQQEQLYFIMHVGPQKTATTTIQCGLRNMEDYLLREKHVAVMETENCHPRPNATTGGGAATYDNILGGATFMPNCLKYWSADNSGMPSCWEESYGKWMHEQQLQNNSVVMSQEMMVDTMKDPHRTKRVFSDMVESLPGFQIVVIATYRRYYDWIVSLYGEKFKSKIKRKLMRWPGNGGIGIPSVETFAARALKRGPPVPFTDVVTRALQDHPGVNIKIINYHAGDSMETAFFCDAMPGATKVCTRNETSSKGANQAPTHFWYDMLATKAFTEGRIPSNSTRKAVVAKMARFQEDTLGLSGQEFPMICPLRKFYDTMLEESLRLEKIVMPKDQHEELESQHMEAFEKARKSHKFCTINTTAVLEEKQWLDFFKSLASTSRKRPLKKREHRTSFVQSTA